MATTTHLVTADELLRWPDDGMRHELLKGALLSFPYASALDGAVTAHLIVLLAERAQAQNSGRLYANCGFKLESNPDTVLGADISFIKRERSGPKSEQYPDGAPDLVVEVFAPDDDRLWFEEKTSRWFQGGALTVWLVDTETNTVEVRQANGERQILNKQDELTGGELLPFFRVRVSEIFDC